MERIGPHRVVSELGIGGMGTVYLAEDAAGERVALKVVHPHLLATPGFFKRFLREAELGRQVRHENVVRTLDADAIEVDGKTVHYLVMEYVEGRSLRTLLKDLGRVPEMLLREIAQQAAAGLAAIHERRIIHRDLKPENVLITPDERLRIMDLGVAKLQEASVAITAEGQFAGSVLYAAPEQFRDEAVGPAADLYSLGVLLYELATGQNPFRRDDVASVIKAHLTFSPPPAGDRNPDLSPFFTELCATLLAKDAAQRVDSAATLHDVLQEGEDSDWWTERERRIAARRDRRPRVPVARDTDALHGRHAAMETLTEAWAAARAGRGGAVLVEGEAGIGKTRLVDQFLRGLAGEDRVHALYGSYPPSGGFGGLADAILAHFGGGPLADALAPYLTVTPSLVPAFAAQMKHETPPAGSEAIRGDALHAVVCHLARALAEERPTVWVVDDLQFASEESRAVALALARAAEGHRLLLILTSRTGLPEAELEHFARLPGFRRLPLGRLSPREVIELLRDALSSEALAEKLGGTIAYKSDGIPFFVFELLRGLKEGAFLRQLPDGSYVQTQVIDDIEVPSAVKDLIEGRLRGLSKVERALLDVGAVQGLAFESRLVAAVLGRKRFGVLQDLAEIERRLGVVRAAGRRYRFDHPQLQEVVYGNLSEELKEECHALLAEAVAKTGDLGGEGHHFVASHHLRGSRPRAALPHLEPALDHLEKTYRNAAILDLADRALLHDGLLDPGSRLAVQRARADVLGRRGRRDEQKVALDDALAAAGDPVALARMHLMIGNYHHAVSQYDEAAASYRAALDLAPRTDDSRLEASATGNLGLVEIAAGRDAEALDLFRRAERLWRDLGHGQGEAATIGNIGLALGNLGHRAESVAYYGKQIAMAREIGDKALEAQGEANLAIHWSHEGRYADMEAHIGRALDLFREIGSRQGEAQNLSNLGILCEFLGRNEKARDLFGRALALCRETGYRRGEGFALRGLGAMAERAGDLDEAVRLYEESLRVRREIGHEYGVFASLLELGQLEATRGNEERAIRYVDEVNERRDDATRPDVLVFSAALRAALPGGDPAAAAALFREHEERVPSDDMVRIRFTMWRATGEREHLDEAHRLVMEIRDHAPETDRESMIENVPVHREIVAAWDAR